jgi:hypothetical protein
MLMLPRPVCPWAEHKGEPMFNASQDRILMPSVSLCKENLPVQSAGLWAGRATGFTNSSHAMTLPTPPGPKTTRVLPARVVPKMLVTVQRLLCEIRQRLTPTEDVQHGALAIRWHLSHVSLEPVLELWSISWIL